MGPGPELKSDEFLEITKLVIEIISALLEIAPLGSNLMVKEKVVW